MEQQPFKYFAFISYNSRDVEWGKRLQRKLEHYRMPATLCSEHGWERTPIKPVFFAPTDIQPGGLTEELQERLHASRNLIVICSPNSAQSEWVGKEIAFFHSLGRTRHIHFFIVDGVPHSADKQTECLNPVVDTLGLPEILGANIHEHIYRWAYLNKERAYVQLISKLLGVEFDAIWQRHKRLLIKKMVAWAVGIVVVLAALALVWVMNKPVQVEVQLDEVSDHNPNLPPMQDAVITLQLQNETKTDTIHEMNEQACFANIPRRMLGKNVHITLTCRDFISLDTTLRLAQAFTLPIRRNPHVYGDLRFSIWNPQTEQKLLGITLEVEGKTVTADAEGRFSFFIPLKRQRTAYYIVSPVPLQRDTLYAPCGDSDVILLQ